MNMLTKTRSMIGFAALCLAAGIAASASAQVSTTANGPYYATPSWDQKLTTNRFVVLANWNNEAVLDRETGLVWEKSPSTALFKWWVDPTNSSDVSAQAHCNSVTVGNRLGWRVPTVQELQSLVDADPANTSSPRLPPGHPFTNVATDRIYLSANPAKEVFDLVWAVGFVPNSQTGRFNGWTGRNLDLRVWCVRGGHDANPQ